MKTETKPTFCFSNPSKIYRVIRCRFNRSFRINFNCLSVI